MWIKRLFEKHMQTSLSATHYAICSLKKKLRTYGLIFSLAYLRIFPCYWPEFKLYYFWIRTHFENFHFVLDKNIWEQMSGNPQLLSMLDITELFSFHTMPGHSVRFELLIGSLRFMSQNAIEHGVSDWVQVERIRLRSIFVLHKEKGTGSQRVLMRAMWMRLGFIWA